MKGKEELIKQINTTIYFLKSAKEERKKELDDLLYGCGEVRVEDIDDRNSFCLGLELEYQIETLTDCIDDLERQKRYFFKFEEV